MPNKPLLVLLAATALLAAAVALLWPGGNPPAPAASVGFDQDDDGSAVVAVAAADDAIAVETAELLPPPADAERSELVLPAGAPASPGPFVLVVRGGQPVAGAAVAFVDRQVAHRLRERRATEISEWDLPATFGSVLHTDVAGRVQLPPLADATLCSAEADGQFAFALLRPRQGGEVRLRLQADETLRLCVRKAGGAAAAGVPLAVYQGHQFGRADRLWHGSSSRDGIAELRHFQLLRRPQRSGNRFCAVVPLPLQEPCAASFAGTPAPTEPVLLQLPEATALSVTLVDPGGTPLLHPATLTLFVRRDKKWSVDLPVDAAFDRLQLDKPVGAAPVLAEPLGLGVPLVPRVHLADDRRDWPAPALATSLRAEAIEALQLRLPDDYAVLAGRLVNGEGSAFVRPVRAELSRLAVPWWHSGVYACADGRFDLPLRARAAPGGQLLELRSDDGGVVLGARVELAALVPGRRQPLGEIAMLPLPPLCRGEVVDDRGEPVAGARLTVQVWGERRGKSDWLPIGLSRAQSSADGSFAVFADAPPAMWRLAAEAGGHQPAFSPAPPAATGVRLQLQRLGTVRARVRVPRWLPPESVSLQCSRLLPPESNRSVSLGRRDGRFVVRDLVPGPYRVQLRLRNLPEPLLQIDALAVMPGDQRLAGIDGLDLEQLVFRYRLRAVGDGGRPLGSLDGPILCRYDGSDGKPRQVGFRWRRGTAELITDRPLVELVLFGEGFQPRTLQLGPGEHDVYLRQLHPIHLRLPGARLSCGYERKVRVSMICSEETGWPQSLRGTDLRSGQQFGFNRWDLGKSGGAWLGDGDEVDVPLSRNGRYEVVLRLYGDGGRGQASVGLGHVDVVLDGPGPETRVVAVDGAKVAAALARLQREAAQRQQRRGQPNRR